MIFTIILISNNFSIPFIVLAQAKINGLGVGFLSIIILTAIIGISLPPAHAEVTKVALVPMPCSVTKAGVLMLTPLQLI